MDLDNEMRQNDNHPIYNYPKRLESLVAAVVHDNTMDVVADNGGATSDVSEPDPEPLRSRKRCNRAVQLSSVRYGIKEARTHGLQVDKPRKDRFVSVYLNKQRKR